MIGTMSFSRPYPFQIYLESKDGPQWLSARLTHR